MTDDEIGAKVRGSRVKVHFRKPMPGSAYFENWKNGSWVGSWDIAEVPVPADTSCLNGAVLLNLRGLRGTDATAVVPPVCRERCVPVGPGDFTELQECPKHTFLEMDLRDALLWLLRVDVRWASGDDSQRGFLLFTALIQARALYEFYYSRGGRDDARAEHFCLKATAHPFNRGHEDAATKALDIGGLYQNYMAPGTPAQKRAFHLVYDRSEHAGGRGHVGTDHINQQAVAFSKDLARVTEKFLQSVDAEFAPSVDYALKMAKAESSS